MTALPHLATLTWNALDQLAHVDLGGGGTAYYVYAGGGRRLRKVIDRLGGRQVEVISLGAVEYYRESGPAGIDFERQTVRLTEEGGEIAQVVTRTVDPADPPGVNKPVLRYQYHNHLGSATLELDGAGALISYEEYHPFGTSAYRSGRSQAEVSLKRYRFTKKERDEETGLYYFGLRYYAPWLGRWISADPAGLVDGLNLYRYARNDPATLCDPDGCNPPTDIRWIVPTDVTTEAAFSTWATREGIQYSGTPRFNAQTQVWAVESWTRVQPGVGGPAQPPTPTLPPAAGQFGHVAPQSQQPPAQYGTPGVPATRLTENEHIIPGQQLRDLTRNPATGQSDYTETHYGNDATVRVERPMALNKTYGNRGGPTADNPRTNTLQTAGANGSGVNYREDVFEASRQNAIRACPRDQLDGHRGGDQPGHPAAGGQPVQRAPGLGDEQLAAAEPWSADQ